VAQILLQSNSVRVDLRPRTNGDEQANSEEKEPMNCTRYTDGVTRVINPIKVGDNG
jgi:hypothetical protein